MLAGVFLAARSEGKQSLLMAAPSKVQLLLIFSLGNPDEESQSRRQQRATLTYEEKDQSIHANATTACNLSLSLSSKQMNDNVTTLHVDSNSVQRYFIQLELLRTIHTTRSNNQEDNEFLKKRRLSVPSLSRIFHLLLQRSLF